MTSPQEKQFARKLGKAGWHTYRDEETQRVVTNAYPDEIAKLSKLSGLALEIVTPAPGDGICARIGPKP